MNIGIVGNGAIGNLLAFNCHTHQIPYTLLTRTGSTFNLTIKDIAGDCHQLTPPVKNINDIGDYSTIILPIKVYQIESAITQLAPQITEQVNLVLLHNGMGTSDFVTSVLPNNPIIAATTSHAAFKPSISECTVTGLGHTFAGWLTNPNDEAQKSVKSLLNSTIAPCEWKSDVLHTLWKKLAVNGIINPLTAIHKIKNGQILLPQYLAEVNGLCHETANVMQALGYEDTPQSLQQSVLKVATNTADNYSSMYQDIAHNRQSEIEFINGHIVKTAAQLKIATPLHLATLERIRKIQKKAL